MEEQRDSIQVMTQAGGNMARQLSASTSTVYRKVSGAPSAGACSTSPQALPMEAIEAIAAVNTTEVEADLVELTL